MASLLPSEIVVKILEYSYYRHAYGPDVDVKTLSACAAVCKQWSSIAQQLQFFEVDLTSKSSRCLENFALLTAPGGLSACIRSLTLFVSQDPAGLDLIAALSHCPALYHLRLRLVIDDSTTKLTELEDAQLAALPMKLRALTFCTHGHEGSHVLYQLLAIWPSIQFLRLMPCKLVPPPEERPPFSLYELTLKSVTPYPEHFIRWLLPPVRTGQRGSLRILSFAHNEYQAYGPFIEYAPGVRSLNMLILGRGRVQQDFLTRFSTLEELVVNGEAPADLDAKGLHLPQTIGYLKFMAAYGASLSRYAAALVSAGLPQLRQLSVNGVPANALTLSRFNDLPEVCRDRGIALLDSWHRRTWPAMEYPVPVDQFPRPWTIANLYRMKVGD